MPGFRGLGPGFSPWLPLKTELNDQQTWVGKFPVDKDVSMWALRKFCHWEASIDLLSVFNAAIAVIGSVSYSILPGIFEYKIIAPDGRVIMWQKIFLTINNVFLTESFIGAMVLSFFVWNALDDRSHHFRSRRIASVEDSEFSLADPIAIAKVDTLDYDTGEAIIRINGTPKNASGQPVAAIEVQRALIDDGLLDSNKPPTLSYETIGNLTQTKTPTEEYWDGLFNQERGTVAVYRLKCGNSYSNGISLAVFGKSALRTRIATYVINGYPTLSHPDLTIPGSERLSYEEYSQWVWFPRNREETMFLDPASGDTVTDIAGVVDTWWNGPVYQFKIPGGSELHLKRDYFALPGVQQYRVRNKQWQFSYKAAESQLWTVIEEVAGNMLQNQTEGTDVWLIAGDRPINGPISSTRAIVTFPDSQGAFLYAAKDGTVFCGLMRNELTQLYISANGGRSFEPLMAGGYQPLLKSEAQLAAESGESPTVREQRLLDEKLAYENAAVYLFNKEAGYRVIDIYKDKQEKIFILAEKGDYLYVQINPQVVGGYGNTYFVNKKVPNNVYKFTDYTEQTGDKMMVVGGQTSSFVSTDGGRTWGYPEGYDEEDYISDNHFEDETISIADGYKNNTGTQVVLGQQEKKLIVELRSGSKVETIYVGEKEDGNVYRMPSYAQNVNNGIYAIYGKNHRYISSNGGRNWERQEVVEE